MLRERLRRLVRGDGEPACARGAGGVDCHTYHLLAPVLHELGLVDSFDSYPDVLRDVVARTISEHRRPSVLVAGIESESSARALLDALSVFHPAPSVTFADRCPTPLDWISRARGAEGGIAVRTLRADLLGAGARDLHGRFPIVLADSFVKQFAGEDKARALGALAASCEAGGTVVVREHFGDLRVLLDGLWRKLPSMLASRADLGALERDAITAGIAQLDEHMTTTGGLYPHLGDLEADLDAAGLRIAARHVADATDAVITTLRR